MTEVLRGPRRLLLRDVEVDGRQVDVSVADGRVDSVGRALVRTHGADVVEGHGGALLPGLHDHHIHLLATAAAAASVVCGPPSVRTIDDLRSALARAPGAHWVRGIAYHESVAGPLDRIRLDEVVPVRPARVQHRSGAVWSVNTPGLIELGVPDHPDGRLWRGDPVLERRSREDSQEPDVSALGAELAASGVLGVTDATPDLDTGALDQLTRSELPQDLLLLGAPDDWAPSHPHLRAGPRKILLRDEDELDWQRLAEQVRAAHAGGRPVAVHTVTRDSLVVVLTVLQETGVLAGDRLEHAAVVPSELLDPLAGLGVTVVTQPAMAADRGDEYLRDVAADDCTGLWRYASLLAAGVPVVPSSDAPYGPHDPWEVLRQARHRLTPAGQVLGAAERVPAATALDGLLAPLDEPSGPPRQVRAGRPADLVLLHAPLDDALAAPSRDLVRLVVAAR